LPIYISILLSIILCVSFGGMIYVFCLVFVDQERHAWFHRMVPLYLKSKYAIILYSIAGGLYFIYSYLTWGGFHLSQMELWGVTPVCVIIGSQAVRLIAKSRNEELEESKEEEIRRKEEHKYDDLQF
jgi:hypothetical protein